MQKELDCIQGESTVLEEENKGLVKELSALRAFEQSQRKSGGGQFSL